MNETTQAPEPQESPLAAAPVATAGPAPHAQLPTVLKRILFGVAGVVLAALVLAWFGGYSYVPVADVDPAAPDPAAGKANLGQIEKKLAALQPKGAYVVVDSAQNRVRLMRRDEVVLEAIASAGTGAELVDEATGRTWVFETPRGVRTVLGKKKNPCWRRPDWDYVENGEPLPKKNSDRIDCAALGKYALFLGDGYMIHGTLYERSLGMSVTHGCVRLGAKDLEVVWNAAPVGTKVYLY